MTSSPPVPQRIYPRILPSHHHIRMRTDLAALANHAGRLRPPFIQMSIHGIVSHHHIAQSHHTIASTCFRPQPRNLTEDWDQTQELLAFALARFALVSVVRTVLSENFVCCIPPVDFQRKKDPPDFFFLFRLSLSACGTER